MDNQYTIFPKKESMTGSGGVFSMNTNFNYPNKLTSLFPKHGGNAPRWGLNKPYGPKPASISHYRAHSNVSTGI